jgi:hypothetical protein
VARELPNTVSLFDYVYIDHVRIGSYLSQMSDEGVLQSVNSEDRTEEKFGRSMSAGVHAIGEVKTGFDKSEGATSVVSRTFDALWQNARSVLDLLDEIGLIERDLVKSSVGQIVLVSGQFSITDLRVMRPLWGPLFEMFGSQTAQTRGARRGEEEPSIREARNQAHL